MKGKKMYNRIIEKYEEIRNLNNALALLNWDQSTYITKSGVISRAETIETIARIFHKKLTSDDFYNQLANITEEKNINQLNQFQQQEILKIKKEVERERKIPIELASKIAKTTSIAMSLWQEAKANNDDKEFLPVLEDIFELKKEVCDKIGYEKNPYDALLDEYDFGLKYDYIKILFDSLEKEISIILDKIKNSKQKINDDFLFKNYPIKKQEDFGLTIIKLMGIDFDYLRQDTSVHPFTARIGLGDVRITTDIKINNFKKGFYSTIHESGHALYEIGVSKRLKNSPFSNINSLSLHESQSRFYENIIGRSKGFWKCFYPRLKNEFNDALKNIGMEDFYHAVNKVEINPFRIESDELTYNLHIILRTKIENDLINNNIAVNKINDAWNENSKKILGYYPNKKSEGYLQDIHWSDGLIGYFPTYTLGNIIASQFYNSMQEKTGKIDRINEEKLSEIHDWFDNNLYILGTKYSSVDTVKNITGEDIDSKYFINYLKDKFFEIYM